MADRGLCLFGGSFNPPHRTHVRVAEAALAILDPDALVVVPCGDHPLKDDHEFAPAEHRLAMCRLAFAGIDRVEVDPLEIERGGRSYTVDTVRALRARIGLDAPLYVLIGSDNLAQLDLWHQHEALFELATLVTYPRRGHPISERALAGVRIRHKHKEDLLRHALRDVEDDAVSSSDIRALLRRAGPVPALQPQVEAYARAHGLYGAARATR